jgi:hypothetical protein
MATNRRLPAAAHHSKLGQQAADAIERRRTLFDEALAHPMQRH